MRVFFSAGEASGDAYAAALLREMRRLVSVPSAPEEQVSGIKKLLYDHCMLVRPWSFMRGHDPGTVHLNDFPELRNTAWRLDKEEGTKLLAPFDNDPTLDDYLAWVLAEHGDLLPEIYRSASIPGEGIGSKALDSGGATLHADSSRWGAISILQALRVAPRVAGGYSKAKYALRKGKPGLFIPIDFGYMNVKLSRYAKQNGWKVLYFIPPGSWRRHKQGKDLPKVADEIVTPFPWSADILRKMGGSAHFFGHPLKQMISERRPVTSDRQTIAILPGSRMHEIKENLPVIAGTVAAKLGEVTGGVTPVGCFDNAILGREGLPCPVEFAVASSVDVDELTRRWKELAPDRTTDTFTQGDTYGVLSRARAAIVCSGTATLEAALCRCPLVVMYRFGKMTEVEIRLRRVRPKYISLPNILLDQDVVPELIQQMATPDRIRMHLERLMVDGEWRDRQLRLFDEIEEMLGPPDAITKTAELALALAGRR